MEYLAPSSFSQSSGQSSKVSPLLELSTDTLLLILDKLELGSPSSLFNVRCTCSALYRLVEPYIYKSVTLYDNSNVELKAGYLFGYHRRIKQRHKTEWLIQCLLQPGHRILKHIRHLRIMASPDSTDLLSKGILKGILRNIKHLTIFSWESSAHIPSGVLSLIHKKWHKASIRVISHQRYNTNKQILMDVALLSSPQLQCLEYTVNPALMSSDSKNGPSISEMLQLQNIIMQSRNLRVLKLRLTPQPTERNDRTPYYFPFGGTPASISTFPPLQELSIRNINYASTREHCLDWRRCMDWSALRVLDLRDALSADFFAALQGAVPRLRVLAFTYGSRHDHHVTGQEASKFLESIEALEELTIVNHMDNFFLKGTLWEDGIVRQHGASLRRFVVNVLSDKGTGPFWTSEGINVLATNFPLIRELDIAVRVDNTAPGRLRMSTNMLTSFCRLSRLTFLRLTVQVPLDGPEQVPFTFAYTDRHRDELPRFDFGWDVLNKTALDDESGEERNMRALGELQVRCEWAREQTFADTKIRWLEVAMKRMIDANGSATYKTTHVSDQSFLVDLGAV